MEIHYFVKTRQFFILDLKKYCAKSLTILLLLVAFYIFFAPRNTYFQKNIWVDIIPLRYHVLLYNQVTDQHHILP